MDRIVSPNEPNRPGTAAAADDQWTVQRIIDWTTQHFRDHGCETPRLDAEILLAHVRRCERIQLYTHYADLLSPQERAAMRDLVKRRAKSEPVAYLVGHREFFGLDFHVSRDVLIPRPDTETLVMESLEVLKPLKSAEVLEIGTGSGCIAVALAVNQPAARITAIDISEPALEIARRNAARHRVEDRITFLLGDLFKPLPAEGRFDLIVSNPPYVAESEKGDLQADVVRHEPHQALFAGPDGLDILRQLVAQAGRFLNRNGWLLLELSPEQASAVKDLITADSDWRSVSVIDDLSGQARVIRCQRGGAAETAGEN